MGSGLRIISIILIFPFAAHGLSQKPVSAEVPITEGGLSQMFQGFSRRAQQVVFLARFKAGQKGAKMIDVDHLLQAIVIQDQGAAEIKKLLGIDPADPIEWPAWNLLQNHSSPARLHLSY